MSYYKHIKTVQAFQLGNIIPIAPVILVVKAGLLFISRRIFHKILINIDHLLGPKNLAKKLPPLRYIDKIPSYVAPVNQLLRILLLRYLLIRR
jgi:hypothetical protein